MLEESIAAIHGITSADPETTTEQRKAILATCKAACPRRLLTKQEASRLLGVHVATLDRFAHRGVIRPGDSVAVSVDITNTGKVKGDEVVQLYLHDEIASVSRPIMELKGFRRVSLDPGETKTVTFTLNEKEMLMLDEAMRWVVEPGDFKVMVGASSEDIRSEGVFTVTAR